MAKRTQVHGNNHLIAINNDKNNKFQVNSNFIAIKCSLEIVTLNEHLIFIMRKRKQNGHACCPLHQTLTFMCQYTLFSCLSEANCQIK